MNQAISGDYTLFDTAEAAWGALYQDCKTAAHSIDIEQYIIARDAYGLKFMQLLIERARQGVRVRLLLDYVGSLGFYESPEINDLLKAGGQVHFYNRLSRFKWLWPLAWFPRNHVKAMRIDSACVHIGSACMREDMRHWRDTTLRITGPLAQAVSHSFSGDTRRWWKQAYPYPRQKNNEGRYFVREPARSMNPIYREIMRAIKGAKHNIRIATPYFMPPHGLRRRLRQAVRRGVRVDVIMNRRSDVYIADLVSHSYLPKLLGEGINVHLFSAPDMLHAKYVLVDDNWVSLGSTNIDYLSLNVNREANMVLHNPDICAALTRQFMQDCDESHPASAADWHARPWPEKLLGYVARIGKGML